jgi:hypothetical protein
MDDSSLMPQSQNEWSIILMNYLTSHIIDGFRSIFNEAVQLCEVNDEMDKYLMTFQNLLSRIPMWNQQMVESEKERIIKLCNCSYLEDLLTCVHIVQLKILSCVRVGSENKKVTINIPDFGAFLHQVYINIARKLYSNIFLFEVEIPDLEVQRRNREMEHLVQTCIMNTIREKIPVEMLLRQYIDETQEVDVKKVETIVETKPVEPVVAAVEEPSPPPPPPAVVVKEDTKPLETKEYEKPRITFNPILSESVEIPAREVDFDDLNDADDKGLQLGEEIPLGDDIVVEDMDKAKDEDLELEILDL